MTFRIPLVAGIPHTFLIPDSGVSPSLASFVTLALDGEISFAGPGYLLGEPNPNGIVETVLTCASGSHQHDKALAFYSRKLPVGD